MKGRRIDGRADLTDAAADTLFGRSGDIDRGILEAAFVCPRADVLVIRKLVARIEYDVVAEVTGQLDVGRSALEPGVEGGRYRAEGIAEELGSEIPDRHGRFGKDDGEREGVVVARGFKGFFCYLDIHRDTALTFKHRAAGGVVFKVEPGVAGRPVDLRFEGVEVDIGMG